MKQTTPFLRSKQVDMTGSVTSNVNDLANSSTNMEEHHYDFYTSTPSPSILISMMPSDSVVVGTSPLMSDDTPTPSPSSTLIDTLSSSVTESSLNNMDDSSPSPTTMIVRTVPFDSVETTSSNTLGENNATPSPSTVTSMVSSSSTIDENIVQVDIVNCEYETTPSPTTTVHFDSAVEETTSNMLGDNTTPSPSSPLTNEMSSFSSSSSSSVKKESIIESISNNIDVVEKSLNNFPTNAPSSVLNDKEDQNISMNIAPTTNPAPSSTLSEEIENTTKGDEMRSESVGISIHSLSIFNYLNLMFCSVVWILHM